MSFAVKSMRRSAGGDDEIDERRLAQLPFLRGIQLYLPVISFYWEHNPKRVLFLVRVSVHYTMMTPRGQNSPCLFDDLPRLSGTVTANMQRSAAN